MLWTRQPICEMAREPSRLTPGIFPAPLHLEAELIYLFGEEQVRIVPEPEKRLAPQQPSARHCDELIIQVAL